MNGGLELIAGLRDRDLLAEGLVVAEGRLLAERLLLACRSREAGAGCAILPRPCFEAMGVACVPSLASVFEDAAGGLCPVTVLAERDLAAIAGFPFHRGVLAWARRGTVPEFDVSWLDDGAREPGPRGQGPRGRALRGQGTGEPDDISLADDGTPRGQSPSVGGSPASHALEPESPLRRLAILPATKDPENIGAIMRSAAALGWDALLVGPESCDHLSRRAVRVSMGAAFSLPVFRMPASGLIDGLRRASWRVIASVLDDEASDLRSEKASGRIALLIGNEFRGLGEEWLESGVRKVTIPMNAGSDSLNAAQAAAVFLWALAPGLDRDWPASKRE